MARLLLILLILASLLITLPVAAQDSIPAAVESAACARVEALMNLAAQTGSKPDLLVRGGGTIRDSTPVQASITADDAGDRWSWGAVNTQANGLSQITLDSNLPLTVRVFKGLSPINVLQDNAPVPAANLAPGVHTVSAQLAGDGYYTLLVRRQNLADTSQTGSYTLTIGANVAGGVAFAPVDWRGQQANQQELIPPDGEGIVPFSPDRVLNLRVPADALRSITVERSIVLELATRGRLSWVRENVRELALLDGSLSIYLNNGGFIYIEDYRGTGSDTITDEFNNFTLADDGRGVRGIDWDTVQNLWLLDGCVGIELRETGQRFIAEGETLTVTERAAPSGSVGQTFAAAGGAWQYNLTVDWLDIERIIASGGRMEAFLVNNRSLLIDRLNATISQPANAPFTISEGNNTLLSTDWLNTRRIEIESDALRVRVDDLRDVVNRTGRVLRTLETRGATMRAFWQDGSQTLLLPESGDFIEIDTPAALPAYESGLRPRQTNEATGAFGYLPTNLNNGGQECYPVNTVFDFNCAANGEVNPANGGLSLTVTDLFARGARLALTLNRTYNSHNALVDGPFGRGWSTDYLLDYAVDYAAGQQARRVTPNMEYPVGLDVTYGPLGLVIYTTGSGSRHAFELDDDGWYSGTMPGWFIARRGDPLTDDWHLARDDGTIYDFDLAGRLKAIRHAYGGALEVTRDSFDLTIPGAPSFYSIADGTGRRILLTFDPNGHIILSELYDGSTLLDSAEYRYDATGLLLGVKYGDGSTASYTYTEAGLLNFHEDPRAPLAQILHYGYDEAGRVIWSDISPAVTPDQCSGAAAPRPFRCYGYASTGSDLTTTVTDEWGRTDSWVYSVSNDRANAYRLLSHTAPDGTPTTYSYGSGDLARFPVNFSRGGLQHQLRWEPFGQLTALQSDAWIGFSATYNTTTRLDINGDGTPEYRLPLLASYRSDGDRGPAQPVTYAYDPATGLPVSLTESSGLLTRIETRAGSFNLPAIITATGGETVNTINLTYDQYGFPITRQDASGVDQYAWDGFGRPTHYERQDGAGITLVSYDLSYNPTGDGRCQMMTDPLGTQTTTCYDFRGRLVEQTMTDSAGEVLEQTRYSYDTFDRLIRTVSQTGGEPVTTTYVYTTEGVRAVGNRRVIETLPNGTQRSTEYDSLDRVIAVQDTTGQVTTYAYAPPTAAAETVTQRDPGGAETIYEYNRARQLIRLDYGPVEWGLLYGGSRASVQREPSQIILNSGQGASTTIDFDSYDSAGRLTQVSFKIRRPDDNNLDAEPVRSDNTRSDMTLRYSYDPQGRLLSIENPVTGEATRLTYGVSEGGRSIVQVDNGQPLTYTYDALNRLVSVESTEGSLSYSYDYDTERGLLNVAVTFSTEDTARAWLLSYDSAGNLREWQDEERQLTRYVYDQRSRLVGVYHVDGDDEIPVAEYAYNTADQVTTIINRDGQEARYVYNARGQLTTRRDFDGVVTAFIYDPQGNVQAVSDGLGFTTSYTYDNRNRLDTITDPLGRQIRYSWLLENTGELRVNSDLLGQTRYIFDLYDRLWQIRDAQDGRHLLRYNFGGQVSEWRQADGALTLGLAYGPEGVLTGINGPESWDWGYAYNSLGQLITRTDPDGASLQLGFDRLGQLTALTALGGDFERRYERSEPGLLTVTQGDYTVSYGYDYYGRLVEETRDEAVTAYEYRDDGFTVFDPDGAVTDYIYTGVLGDVEVPYLIAEFYSPEGDLALVRNYRYTQRGELVGIEQEDYFSEADTPYTTEERINYDAEGRPIRYIDAENNLYAYSYDLAGRLNTTQYPDGGIYSYTYDRLNRLTGLSNPTGQQLRMTYNPLGYLTGVALNNTALESYTYSPVGWLLTRAFANYPDGAGQISYRYSPGGLPLGWTIGNRSVTIERAPDALHQLVRISDGDHSADYTFDAAGNLTSAGDLTYAYDSLGRLAGVESDGDIITYTYSAGDAGSELAINLPDSQTLTVRLDNFRHIQHVEASGQPIEVAYELLDGDDLEARMTWANRYTAQVRFNRLGQILLLQYQDEAASQRLQRFAYTLNYAGIPLAIDDRENDILLGYDNVYRPLTTSWLVTAGLRPTDSVDYAFTVGYDAQGNRVRELRQGIDGSVAEVFYAYDSTGTLLRSRTVGSAVAVSSLGIIGVIALALRRKRRLLPVLLVTLAGGLWIVQAQTPPTYEYVYNDAGHVESITNRSVPDAPVTTNFAYDGFGRLVQINVGEDTRRLRYDALGRLVALETGADDVFTEYRYNGDRLVSIIEDETERVVVGVLDGQYLLLTDGADARWTLYDALGAVRQSFVNEPGSSNSSNRFDILGRGLEDTLAPGTPLALPLFQGMLYDADHSLYIGLDGRAYDPAAGRYLQRSLTGPDAVGNLYNRVLQAANPPAQVFNHDPLVEPLALLDEHTHLLDAPTASSVRAGHLPDVYAGWQDAGLQALGDFQAAQRQRFTDMAQGAYALIYGYNRTGILPDASGNLRLFDTANPAAPAFTLPPMQLPQVNLLPAVSLRWTPQIVSTELQPARWFNPDAWRGLPNWSLAAPQPLLGERASGAITDVLALPLTDAHEYADWFRALDDLPVAAAADWIAEIEADVLPTRPFLAPENALAWLRNWFTDDTLPVWSQLRALHALPDAPGVETGTLNLR